MTENWTRVYCEVQECKWSASVPLTSHDAQDALRETYLAHLRLVHMDFEQGVVPV